MPSPLLTIIIATFNSSRTLQRTLDSVLSQDWQGWEVLVVDGGSGDNTVEIIEENERRDDRIRYVSEQDNGVYDAMNKGIGLARGEWVYFLGSDDWLLNRQVLHSVFSESEIRDFNFVYGNVISASYEGVYDGEFTFEKLLSRNISHQAIFYKRGLFDRIGNYNLRYRAHADWDLNLRCFADSRILVKYVNVVVAEFGAFGISAQHDVPFLREVLIPEKLRMLAGDGIRRLRKVTVYDEWWRLLRNAGIRSVGELGEIAGGGMGSGQQIPGCIKGMVRWQRLVPQKVLRTGPFSKSLMFVSYLIHRLTGDI